MKTLFAYITLAILLFAGMAFAQSNDDLVVDLQESTLSPRNATDSLEAESLQTQIWPHRYCPRYDVGFSHGFSYASYRINCYEEPCRHSPIRRSYHKGDRFYVNYWTRSGEDICLFHYRTRDWYFTRDLCWVWLGVTDSAPRYSHHC
jgi:hypothetical protein